jgi:hypothetical protein
VTLHGAHAMLARKRGVERQLAAALREHVGHPADLEPPVAAPIIGNRCLRRTVRTGVSRRCRPCG